MGLCGGLVVWTTHTASSCRASGVSQSSCCDVREAQEVGLQSGLGERQEGSDCGSG